MQTSPISNPANVLPGPASNTNAAPENGAPAFDQVLSREVAGRRNAEAPANSQAAGKTSGAKPAPTDSGKSAATSTDGATNATESPSKDPKTIDTPANDAAALASAELLALVANVTQLQPGRGETKLDSEAKSDAPADPELEPATLDLKPGLRRSSPFSVQQAALGARANHGNQSRPDGTWAAQVERGSTQRIEPGKVEQAAALQASLASGVSGTAKATATTTATGTDFGAVMKDVNQLAQPAQQALAVQNAAAAATQTADRLNPRVGTPGWDQALGQKIVWMVNGENQSASLTLNPPDLGPLKVVLQITNAQANATFVAAQPEVRQALEAAMPRLREMLEDAGIQLGQASVDSGSPDQQHASERHMGRTGSGSDTTDANALTPNAGAKTLAVGKGLVDTFA